MITKHRNRLSWVVIAVAAGTVAWQGTVISHKSYPSPGTTTSPPTASFSVIGHTVQAEPDPARDAQ